MREGGELIIREWKGYGERKGSRCQRNNPNEVDYGSMMDPVSGSGRSIRIISGTTIS